MLSIAMIIEAIQLFIVVNEQYSFVLIFQMQTFEKKNQKNYNFFDHQTNAVHKADENNSSLFNLNHLLDSYTL